MKVQDYLLENTLLFDGAMATYLAEKYPELASDVCERLNITQPEIVKEIHREYIRAGAGAVKTNTFSANEMAFQDNITELQKVIKQGWKLAGEAVEAEEKPCFVFADIGSVPAGEEVSNFQVYKKTVDIFLECGAENFLFETLENPEGIGEIASYIKQKNPDSFILVSFAASPEGYTQSGFLVKKLFWQMQQEENIDAVGFNCLSGPKHMLEMLERFCVDKRRKYLSVMPNAGYPTMLGNRVYYGKSRKYFGNVVYELAKKGAGIVGGCCGTTPKDIANIADLLKKNPPDNSLPQEDLPEEQTQTRQILGKENEKNMFARKLKAGEKVIVVELDPPLEPDIDFFMEGAARYKYAGVDAIDIADCPIAKARIDSSLLACKVSRELGMITIPHMTCRDRNFNATKALLLGLNVEGINNVLTVTGDPVPVAMREQIKTVFSYNSAVLARHIQSVNQEVFPDNPFMVSGALNINAVNFEAQISHARKKIENGVAVLFTQPVLSERGLQNLKYAREQLDVKILGGIMPVVSYRNATFMNNEMAGIDVQDEIIQLYEGKNREEGEELACKISKRIIDEITPYVDGYYVITPFKRVELILKIVGYIKGKNK